MNKFSNIRGEPEVEDDMDEDADFEEYYTAARSWTADREQQIASSRKTAWMVAAGIGVIALLEAIALVILLPLKTVEPYTLLVDRQTGYVQALDPLEGQSIRPDEAMVRSFLAQYVIAREGFDIDTLQTDYRKVALWSDGDARRLYVSQSQASNPASKLATLPRQARIEVEVRSISEINSDTALVRYVTYQTSPGGQRQSARPWAAVVRYRFSGEAMSAEDRLINPLGFQVVRYSRSAEMAQDTPVTTQPVTTQFDANAPAPLPAARRRATITPILPPGEAASEDADGSGEQGS